ncbi:unnamed protein product, partial [Closterium sp. Naga37s-1]
GGVFADMKAEVLQNDFIAIVPKHQCGGTFRRRNLNLLALAGLLEPTTADLAQNKHFEDPAFVNYIHYLQYWRNPPYSTFIVYPHCLYFLELLQSEHFRTAMAHPANKELAHGQQFYFWQHYRNNRLKMMHQQRQLQAAGEGETDTETSTGGPPSQGVATAAGTGATRGGTAGSSGTAAGTTATNDGATATANAVSAAPGTPVGASSRHASTPPLPPASPLPPLPTAAHSSGAAPHTKPPTPGSGSGSAAAGSGGSGKAAAHGGRTPPLAPGSSSRNPTGSQQGGGKPGARRPPPSSPGQRPGGGGGGVAGGTGGRVGTHGAAGAPQSGTASPGGNRQDPTARPKKRKALPQ